MSGSASGGANAPASQWDPCRRAMEGQRCHSMVSLAPSATSRPGSATFRPIRAPMAAPPSTRHPPSSMGIASPGDYKNKARGYYRGVAPRFGNRSRGTSRWNTATPAWNARLPYTPRRAATVPVSEYSWTWNRSSGSCPSPPPAIVAATAHILNRRTGLRVPRAASTPCCTVSSPPRIPQYSCPIASIRVSITHFSEGPHCYVRLAIWEESFMKMIYNLNRLQLLKPYVNPSAGDFVQAFHPVQGLWHRARVLSVNRESLASWCRVFFVDVGDEATVQCRCVYKLGTDFFRLPCCAMLVRLQGVATVTAQVAHMLRTLYLIMKPVAKERKPPIVTLHTLNGHCINQIMGQLENNVAIPDELANVVYWRNASGDGPQPRTGTFKKPLLPPRMTRAHVTAPGENPEPVPHGYATEPACVRMNDPVCHRQTQPGPSSAKPVPAIQTWNRSLSYRMESPLLRREREAALGYCRPGVNGPQTGSESLRISTPGAPAANQFSNTNLPPRGVARQQEPYIPNAVSGAIPKGKLAVQGEPAYYHAQMPPSADLAQLSLNSARVRTTAPAVPPNIAPMVIPSTNPPAISKGRELCEAACPVFPPPPKQSHAFIRLLHPIKENSVHSLAQTPVMARPETQVSVLPSQPECNTKLQLTFKPGVQIAKNCPLPAADRPAFATPHAPDNEFGCNETPRSFLPQDILRSKESGEQPQQVLPSSKFGSAQFYSPSTGSYCITDRESIIADCLALTPGNQRQGISETQPSQSSSDKQESAIVSQIQATHSTGYGKDACTNVSDVHTSTYPQALVAAKLQPAGSPQCNSTVWPCYPSIQFRSLPPTVTELEQEFQPKEALAFGKKEGNQVSAKVDLPADQGDHNTPGHPSPQNPLSNPSSLNVSSILSSPISPSPSHPTSLQVVELAAKSSTLDGASKQLASLTTVQTSEEQKRSMSGQEADNGELSKPGSKAKSNRKPRRKPRPKQQSRSEIKSEDKAQGKPLVGVDSDVGDGGGGRSTGQTSGSAATDSAGTPSGRSAGDEPGKSVAQVVGRQTASALYRNDVAPDYADAGVGRARTRKNNFGGQQSPTPRSPRTGTIFYYAKRGKPRP